MHELKDFNIGILTQPLQLPNKNKLVIAEYETWTQQADENVIELVQALYAPKTELSLADIPKLLDQIQRALETHFCYSRYLRLLKE